jgi:pilus assembly protein CpaC
MRKEAENSMNIHLKRHNYALAAFLLITCLWSLTSAQTVAQMVGVSPGQSVILDFTVPIKRISLVNPEIVEATVVSPKQLLINGKAIGITSVIVWDNFEAYKIFNVKVEAAPASSQIILHVRFAEVDKTALKELGVNLLAKNVRFNSSAGSSVDLGSFGGKVNTPSDPLNLSETVDFFFNLPGDNLSGIIKALEEEDLLTTLAKPNLTAVNGDTASFLAGGEIPVPISSGTGDRQTVTVMYKEFGVKLKFVPRVLDSSTVNINVKAEVSALDFDNGVILSGFRIPALTTRRAETTVELGQGKFLVIGGLLTQEMTKKISRVPILGRIPVLGMLFSSRRFANKETELLIILSPDIIHGVEESGMPGQIRELKY